jgi:septation ring formation regulator EzrA
MSDNIGLKRSRSEATRALIQERALERGRERSGALDKRVREMMATIDQEIAANEGIYPHNGGALSAAELARRAGVHQTTFFTPTQRETLGKDVKAWIEKVKASHIVGKGPVRRNLSERLEDWKALYEGLAQSHRDTELELQQAEAELNEARSELERVRDENETLKELLAKSGHTKIVPLRKTKD